jgi:EmrB/QacA subfamily drug resistance transporter
VVASTEAPAAAPVAAPPPPRKAADPWLVLGVLCTGFFMTLIDTTAVNVALPALSAGLNASISELLWVINAYSLAFAALLITAGRLGDLYGQKRFFLAGLAVFTVASAACGLAQTPAQLIGFRAAQGVGSALLMPQTLALITVVFPADKRAAAFGVWGTVVGLATLTGPVLGGWLVTEFDWRWVFFVNLPVGVAALVASAILVPGIRLNRRHRLDLLGLFLSAGSLVLVTFGLIQGQYYHWGQVWGPITTWEVIGTGVVGLGLFAVVEWWRRSREPLIPFALFTDRNFAAMTVAMLAMGAALIGVFLPLALFLQPVMGLSALEAGLTLAPMSLISLVVAPFAGRLARHHAKWILLAGTLFFAAAVAALIPSLGPGMSRWNLAPTMILGGLGVGLTFAPLQTLAMRNVEPRMAGAAAGVINTARQLGGVLGSVTTGAILQVWLPVQMQAAATNQISRFPKALPRPAAAILVSAVRRIKGGDPGTGVGRAPIVPTGVPARYRGLVASLARAVFEDGLTDAVRITLQVPLAVMGVACVSVLLATNRRRGSGRHRAQRSGRVRGSTAPP